MKAPDKTPEMQPRELNDGSGWYVLVNWRDRPSQQVGGFPTREEAEQWIAQSSGSWLKALSEMPRHLY